MTHYVHNIDPIMLSLNLPIIGEMSISWYGFMYVVGILGVMLAIKQYTKITGINWSWDTVTDIGFYVFIGAILGGRLGYMLFYAPDIFFSNPLSFFDFKHGGMSFHGGFLGVWFAAWLYSIAHKMRYWCLIDILAIGTPISLFFGRIGNFINGELWGAPTDVPWAMIFPLAGDNLPRHPSMLYEAFLEGLVLFMIVWLVARRSKHHYHYPGIAFILFYGLFRILIEFVREPDAHIGYLLGTHWLTVGMVLSLPLVALGLYGILAYATFRKGTRVSCLDSMHWSKHYTDDKKNPS